MEKLEHGAPFVDRARQALARHLSALTELRRELHREPELSGEEAATAVKMRDVVARFGPTEIVTGLGGHGLAAIYESGAEGPTVLLRAELDALPMQEAEGLAHRSRCDGIAHKCGHDGHMAILAGAAALLDELPPVRGRVVLLFQPAEETGEGAARVVTDPSFKRLTPDVAFALHNYPGLAHGVVTIRPGPFTAASVGLQIQLRGAPSHASSPQLGRSPARALARIGMALTGIADEDPPAGALVTITCMQMGTWSFGISPGDAELLVTLRTHDDHGLATLIERAVQIVRQHAGADGLDFEVIEHDAFPATTNHAGAVSVVEAVARDLGLVVERPAHPFPWSEDFGHFLRRGPGALFVLGAGDGPPIHTDDYDFSDALIEPGALLLFGSAIRALDENVRLEQKSAQ